MFSTNKPGRTTHSVTRPVDYDESVVRYDYTIIQTLPHSSSSFTQGLVSDGDHLIESSGLYGKSFVHRYPKFQTETSAGDYKQLDDELFAEGIAIANGKLYLLTWKAGQAFVLDPDTLTPLGSLAYDGEGWGLATYGKELVMSNGSNLLTFRNPANFHIVRSLHVTNRQKPVKNLNDLTVAQGLIWANVWHSSDILAIDPDNGKVVGALSLTKLVLAQQSLSNSSSRSSRENVLNGIAWDEQQQGFWVTGKLWDKRYLIQLSH